MSHSSTNSSAHSQLNAQKAQRQQRLTIGQLGEDLTRDWLQAQGGRILEQRWRCHRGELDLVALMPTQASRFLIAFVEVKTRSRGSWDKGGLLSITPAKQRKLWHGAQSYLAQNPRYAPLPCRLDVALVHSQKLKQEPKSSPPSGTTGALTGTQTGALEMGHSLEIGQPVIREGYRLTLQHYLENAFQLD